MLNDEDKMSFGPENRHAVTQKKKERLSSSARAGCALCMRNMGATRCAEFVTSLDVYEICVSLEWSLKPLSLCVTTL